MTARLIVGDVFEALRKLPDASVDLVLCSPPFLALRSYLPADHPDKAKEIGSEATPADFLDTLLDVVEECRRVLAPHGSLVFELGDTYSGSGGAGGDYDDGGLRDGQERFNGSAAKARAHATKDRTRSPGNGWPLDKSLCFIPELFGASLAYGRNLLNPERTTEPWRIRNVVAWCRSNPPVGALGDKCRPATSYLTVATVSRTRWWDMEPLRTPQRTEHRKVILGKIDTRDEARAELGLSSAKGNGDNNPAGAPLLDYWEIPTQPYKGSHYATWPEEIARRCILLMCPEKVCTECGEPSRRIVETTNSVGAAHRVNRSHVNVHSKGDSLLSSTDVPDAAERVTLGWTDCGHNAYRPGIVLDPFAGSGTTLRMALGNGRSGIGIDIDSRNADLALERVGPLYLEVEA